MKSLLQPILTKDILIAVERSFRSLSLEIVDGSSEEPSKSNTSLSLGPCGVGAGDRGDAICGSVEGIVI